MLLLYFLITFPCSGVCYLYCQSGKVDSRNMLLTTQWLLHAPYNEQTADTAKSLPNTDIAHMR